MSPQAKWKGPNHMEMTMKEMQSSLENIVVTLSQLAEELGERGFEGQAKLLSVAYRRVFQAGQGVWDGEHLDRIFDLIEYD
jgi:hypothetical protein